MTLVNIAGKILIGFSLTASLIGIVSFYLGKKNWGKIIGYFIFFAMTLASAIMMNALLSNDFSVPYVAMVGAKETPRFYAALSLWSSLEGSILLWGWVLSAYTALCFFYFKKEFEDFLPSVGMTLFAIGFFFYLVLFFPANPFGIVNPVPDNGPGPNPLLQNHWLMGIHPPMLYLGYVGMSIPFAFAVATLVKGDFSNRWIQASERWMLMAWACLSVAIILGGWWSYAVLGWGGYWAWDPVENASFMPWLTATAFLHSIMVTKKTDTLKIWNLILVVVTFLLTLLGTFLTRSGILESVHSFTESGIGHYFLIAIALVFASSVGLLLWQSPKLKSSQSRKAADRKTMDRQIFFLINNLLFASFCFVVLFGTLYPLIAEALRGVKVTVGKPFFNQMSAPLALGLILLMGFGTSKSHRSLLWPSVISIVLLPIGYALGIKNIYVLLTIVFGIFSFSIMLFEMISDWNPNRHGGFIIHIGIIVIAMGIAFSGNYQKEHQATLNPGESMQAGRYKIEFEKLMAYEKPQRFEVLALTNIYQDSKMIGHLKPQLNFYPRSSEPIGTPSLRSTITQDLYLTLMAFDPSKDQATIRAIITPAVSWIWGGGGILIVGVLISAGFKNRREK